MRLCTIPLTATSMVAITRQRIESSCLRIGELAVGSARFDKVMSWLDNAVPSGFDAHLVRATITLPDRSKIYISGAGELDHNGVLTKLRSRDRLALMDLFDDMEEEWEARCARKLGTPGCEAGGQDPAPVAPESPRGQTRN